MARLRIGFVWFFVCLTAMADPLRLPSDCATDPTECVVDLFFQISRIYRPSMGEEKLRQAIVELAELAARQKWNLPSGFVTQVDSAGNLLIRLPGTGPFAVQSEQIALQSHMDMVTVVKDQPAEADVAPFFANGVDIVREQGVLHSRGYATTLGADNGIGVAIMLRYLVDPSIAHPPLELVFTVCEEKNGMWGARHLELDLQSTVLINLDEEVDDSVCYGCMGSDRVKVSGPLAAQTKSDFAVLQVQVSGLQGGHSAAALHRERANAVQLAARVLSVALEKDPACRLLSLESGNIDKLNVIPSEFTLRLAVAPGELARLAGGIEETFPMLLALYSDETKSPTLHWKPLANHFEHPPFDRWVSERVARVLVSTPNNLMVSADPELFPHGLLSGSSVGFARIAKGEGEVAFMARAYRPSALADATFRVRESLMEIWAGQGTVTPLASTPAWDADPSSWLMELITKTVGAFSTAGRAIGGLEVGVIAEKYPRIEGVAVGPRIDSAHEPTESIQISSIAQVVVGVDTLVEQIGRFRQSGLTCAEFIERWGRQP